MVAMQNGEVTATILPKQVNMYVSNQMLDIYEILLTSVQKWGDISVAITEILHDQGAIQSAEVDKLSVADASALHPWAPLIWGGNARSRADRLRGLGWKAGGKDVFDSLLDMVAEEVRNLGRNEAKTTFDL